MYGHIDEEGVCFWGGGQLQISHVVLVVGSVWHHHLRVCVYVHIDNRGVFWGGRVNSKYLRVVLIAGSVWRHHLCIVCVCIEEGGGGGGLSSGTLPRGRRVKTEKATPPHATCRFCLSFFFPLSCNLSSLSEFFLPQKAGDDKLHEGGEQKLTRKKETLHKTKHQHRKLQ